MSIRSASKRYKTMRYSAVRAFSIAFVAASALCLAQIGGQYPGGGYPQGGGQVPGIGGIPFPRKTKKSDKAKKKDMEQAVLKGVRGTLRKLDTETLILQSEDKRILRFRAESSTIYFKGLTEIKPDAIQPGDHLLVEYGSDDDGKYFAGRVTLEKAGANEERAAARVPVESMPKSYEDSSKPESAAKPEAPVKAEPGRKVAKNEEESEPAAPPPGSFTEVRDATVLKNGDDERPRLTRGKPAPRKRADEDEPVVIASAPTRIPDGGISVPTPADPVVIRNEDPPEREGDPIIEKTRENAYNLLESLPNYTAKQLTTRFQSTTVKTNWQAMDNISIDLVYQEGKERYTNVLLNGKPSKGKAEETGAWSTGEFGTTIRDLFSTSTQADFRPLRATETIAGRTAVVYNFYVKQENSHWRIHAPAESYSPAYRGTVWIDKETSRVLRIEMQSRNMPQEFPIDKVESTLDYEFVRLGTGKFLLPVKSESLSCFRGSSNCSRNVIEFRNYRKFGSESSITFTP